MAALRHRFGVAVAWLVGLALAAGSVATAADNPAAPPSAATNTALFRFVACADPHMSQNLPNQLTGEEKFSALLDAIRRLPEPHDFLLILGDICPTTNTVRLLKEARQVLPTHIVWGNNDVAEARAQLRPLFEDDFKGKDFYSFQHKGWLFIGLCDAIPYDHIGHLSSDFIKGGAQVTWLRGLLAAAAKKSQPVILFGHIPLPAEPADANMWLAINDQTCLRDLIARYKPTAFFFGHMHGRNEFSIGQTQVAILPSICWNFGEQPTGFFTVAVSKDGIQTTFIPLPQTPADSGSPSGK